MSANEPPTNYRAFEDYEIGVICALPHERSAVEAMLTESHGKLAKSKLPSKHDDNDYTYGRIGAYNVIIASLPIHHCGNVPAAEVATLFRGPKYRFLVGIAAGIPQPSEDGTDVRLGDVVVSTTNNSDYAVISYDAGRDEDNDFKVSSQSELPPRDLLKLVSGFRSHHRSKGPTYMGQLAWMLADKPEYNDKEIVETYYGFPDIQDNLFKAGVRHNREHRTCQACLQIKDSTVQRARRVQRRDLPEFLSSAPGVRQRPDGRYEYPLIHYGPVGSADRLEKNATNRDLIFKRIEEQKRCKILCLEMAANGTLHAWGSCLIIPGICDYGDSHKNDAWQNFAAAMAAAYLRDLILYMAPARDSTQINFRDLAFYEAPLIANRATANNEQRLHEALKELRDDSTLLRSAERYWMAMTPRGLSRYDEIWTIIARGRRTVLIDDVWNALMRFCADRVVLQEIWGRFTRGEAPLAQGEAMAVLYMMHLEHLHPQTIAHSKLEFKHYDKMMDRFRAMAHWQPCLNRCGLQWNFVASDYGFCRTRPELKFDRVDCLLLRLCKDNFEARAAGELLGERYDYRYVAKADVEEAAKLKRYCRSLWFQDGSSA